jgi:rhodanese-related sulfurtransferase
MKFLFTFLISLLAACTMNGQQAGTASTAEFEKLIADPNVQVLDVRTAEEYKSGHIENALQANWLNKSEFFDRTAHLDKSKHRLYLLFERGKKRCSGRRIKAKGLQCDQPRRWNNRMEKRKNKPFKGVDPNAKQTSIASYRRTGARVQLWVLVDFGAAVVPAMH